MTIQAPLESRQTMHRYGMTLILMAGVFFTLMSLGVRTLRGSFQSHNLVFYRSLFQMVVLLPWVGGFFVGGATLPSKLRIHLLRGTFGIASMYFLYVALGHLPLGLANLLAMTSVLWAALLSRFFLKEKWTVAQAVASVISCVGIAITLIGADPNAPSWSWDAVGVAAALACGLFMGLALTVLRQMRQALGVVEIVFFFGLAGVVMTLPAVLMRPELPSTGDAWSAILFISGMATLGQLLMTTGFRYTTTLVGTVCKLVEPLFNLGVGFLALREVPPPGFLGGAILVLAGIGILLATGRRARPVYNSNTVGV